MKLLAILEILVLNEARSTRELNPECKDIKYAERCQTECETTQISCIASCEDQTCLSNCNRDYVSCENDCPCYTNCSDGCPCSYESTFCPHPDDVYFFVMEPAISAKQHKVTWVGETQKRETQYFYPTIGHNTDYFKSFTLKGVRHLVGGGSGGGSGDDGKYLRHYTLTSSINEIGLGVCGYQQRPPLPWSIADADVIAFKNESEVMFCGLGSPARKCSYYDGTSFTDAPSTNGYHLNAKLLEINDNGDLIMIAGQNNLNVELLPYGGDTWEIISQMDDVHFKNGYYHFTAARLGSKYIYTFGGFAGASQITGLKNIYKMDLETYEWQVHGQQLIYPRTGHVSMARDNTVWHIGGATNDYITRWKLSEDEETFEIENSSIYVPWWGFYPTTFFVDEEFSCT